MSSFDIKIIDKDKINLIGIMGQGASGSNMSWIQEIWDKTNASLNEIADLVKTTDDGNILGFWGAMSDIDEFFMPWNWQGKYLAGCEVKENSIPPAGWTKWTIPAFKYVLVKCKRNEYQEAFNYILNSYLVKQKYNLVGATQEFYDINDNYEYVNLLFPIERL